MSTLPIGDYRTENGSTMKVHGKTGGKSSVEFDWIEEGACCDCQPEAYDTDGYLVWHCIYCGGGRAKLYRVEVEL